MPRRSSPKSLPARALPSDPRWRWLGFALVVALLRWMLAHNPAFTELFYTGGFYLAFRWVWDHSLGLLPFPVIWLVLLMTIIFIVRRLRYRFRQMPGQSWWHRTLGLLFSLAAFIAGVWALFMLMWGLNYLRPGLDKQLNLDLAEEQALLVKVEFEAATEALIEARYASGLPIANAIQKADLPAKLEDTLRRDLRVFLKSEGLISQGRVRCKPLAPPGLLLGLGASGVYLSWAGESYYDPGLAEAALPYVMAHELAHGMGYAGEGEANFLALLTCMASDHPVIRYAGALGWWRETARLYVREDASGFRQIFETLPMGVQADLAAIRMAYQRHPGFFPGFSNWFYERYLRSQGIEEGMQNYSEVVSLMAAWRRKQTD